MWNGDATPLIVAVSIVSYRIALLYPLPLTLMALLFGRSRQKTPSVSELCLNEAQMWNWPRTASTVGHVCVVSVVAIYRQTRSFDHLCSLCRVGLHPSSYDRSQGGFRSYRSHVG